MKTSARTILPLMFLLAGMPAATRAATPAPGLESGPCPVGFELLETSDPSRSFPAADGSGIRNRPMRIYIWYPARETGRTPLTVGDFVRMAADDFRLSDGPSGPADHMARLPVPLAKGLDEARLRSLLEKPLRAFPDVPAAPGPFPLLVLGQGLYYESPLSQVLLCEYLASRGYVVVTCPLLGTQYRLANISIEDLETQVRDMEFIVGRARSRNGVHPRDLGLIGYDLGGMAGLIATMRNPGVDAFLSLDCAIIFPHYSGLPNSHPNFVQNRFTVPWMHITQGRFVDAARQDPNPNLLGRKASGDSWIVSVPTDCHGLFTSYAAFGIRAGIRGYWDSMADDAPALHDRVCRLAGDFFDAVLKKEAAAAGRLKAAEADAGPFKIEHRPGASLPPSSRYLMHRIIEKGLSEVRPVIDRLKAADPSAAILEEKELNWLAYHFLLWWGREAEALDAFRLNAELHPGSAEAQGGLGEAYLICGRKDEAIKAFRRALEINPDLPNVKAVLESLAEEK